MSSFLTTEQIALAIANHTMSPPPWWNPFIEPDNSILSSPQYMNYQNTQLQIYEQEHPTPPGFNGNDDTADWSGSTQNNTTYTNGSVNLRSVAK